MKRQPLKYHGGKYYLAEWIIGRFPPHIHYVEPFCGGAAVLFQKPISPSEIINDLDWELTNFFQCLREPIAGDLLLSKVALTQFNENEFITAQDMLNGSEPVHNPSVPLAWAYFVVNRMSRSGLGKSFTPLTINRLRGKRNADVNAWLNAVNEMPQFIERMKNVLVRNTDAISLIRECDSVDTLFYCDPPYLDITCEYKHSVDHGALLRTLKNIKGKFVLSGYRSAMYDYELSAFCHEEFSIANHAAAGLVKEQMTEVIWMNY